MSAFLPGRQGRIGIDGKPRSDKVFEIAADKRPVVLAGSRHVGGVVNSQIVLNCDLHGVAHTLVVHAIECRWACETNKFDNALSVGLRAPARDGDVGNLIKREVERSEGDRIILDGIVLTDIIFNGVISCTHDAVISRGFHERLGGRVETIIGVKRSQPDAGIQQ